MSRKEKKPIDEGKEEQGISRRDFLKDAGLIVGGTAIGSTALLVACGGEEVTKTVTQTQTTTATTTATTTSTITAAGPTVTSTVTETISKFVCPYDGLEFDTLEELQAHIDAEHPAEPAPVRLVINGVAHEVQVKPNWTLSQVLREKLGLTGTKVGCDRGECGACTVIIEGCPILSCMILAIECDSKEITTIEGLADGSTLHPIQQAFIENFGFQCGFCTPGMIMTAKALLDKNPKPTEDEVKTAISGNLCRCTGYYKIVKSILNVKSENVGGL